MRIIKKNVQRNHSFFSRIQMYVLFGLGSFLAVVPLASTNADYTIQKKGRGVNFESACWSAPSVPQLVSPANGSSVDLVSPWLNNPVLDWKESENECPDARISYDVEVYLDSELRTLVASGSALSTSQYLSTLSADGNYYWRVRAKDQDSHVSEFSETWKVSISRSTLSAPQLNGWNLQSRSTEVNKTPVDLVCGDTTNGGNIEHVSIAPHWTVAEGQGVLYQLEASMPNGSVNNQFYKNSLTSFWNVGSYPEIQGQWKMKMRTVIDADGNGEYTNGELVSEWGNECNITFDKESPDVPAIVMNEIFPSPSSADSSSKPDGEWVEIYNRSGSAIDVNGWTLYDNDNNHALPISTDNSDNNDNPYDSGETVVPGHGYLVVYRNGDHDFDLDNNGDTVRLFSGSVSNGALKDSYTYSATPTNKSIARIDDGANNWVDPIGTPGRKNFVHQADLQPSVNIDQQDNHRFQIGLFDAINYQIAHFTVQYMRKQDEQLVHEEFTKDVAIDSNNAFIRDLFLGTTSSDVEYPHFGIEQVRVQIILTGTNIPDRTLSIDLSRPWSESP